MIDAWKVCYICFSKSTHKITLHHGTLSQKANSTHSIFRDYRRKMLVTLRDKETHEQ